VCAENTSRRVDNNGWPPATAATATNNKSLAYFPAGLQMSKVFPASLGLAKQYSLSATSKRYNAGIEVPQTFFLPAL